MELFADALRRDEEPVARDAPASDGLQAAADRAERAGPVGSPTAEFEPRVPQALRMRVPTAQKQIPFHLLLPVAVRLHPVRGELTIQQERQRESEHLGLAGSVVAAQQEPAVVEPELLGVVVEYVDQAGPQWLPPLRRGRWQHRLSPFSFPGWSARPGQNGRSPAGCGDP